MRCHKRILLLAAFHLVVALGCAVVGQQLTPSNGPPDAWLLTAIVAFIGLWGGQIALLGVWGGLAPVKARWRLGWMAAGSAFLWCIANTAGRTWGEEDDMTANAFFAFVPAAVIAGALSLARRRRLCLELLDPKAAEDRADWVQCTLKRLFILTVAVAVLLALGNLTRELDDKARNAVLYAVIFPIVAICGIAVGVASLWAGLGLRSPLARAAIALALAAIAGIIPSAYIARGGSRPWEYLIWPSLMCALAACVIASLWVVRSCGYRLVRMAPRTKPAGIEAAASLTAAAAGNSTR